MNLYIKNLIKKHFMWFILGCIFCMIYLSVIIVNYRTNKLCQETSDISTIIGCAGIESNDSMYEKNLQYLQSKKSTISNNSASYGFLSYYLKMVELNNLSSNSKLEEYRFLLQQIEKCRLKEDKCTMLYIVLLERAYNKKLTSYEKITIYEEYLDNIIIKSNQPCIIDENYTNYKETIKETHYDNKFLNKFDKCLEIKKLN